MRDAVSLKTNRVVFTWNKMRRRNQSYRGTTLRKHTSVYNETSITNVTFILLNMTTTSSVWSRYTAEQIGGSDVVISCDLLWPNRLWKVGRRADQSRFGQCRFAQSRPWPSNITRRGTVAESKCACDLVMICSCLKRQQYPYRIRCEWSCRRMQSLAKRLTNVNSIVQKWLCKVSANN